MFSLVVCTVDRFDRLERLFQSLRAQTCRDFEVVLVDQNPDDRLVPVIENYRSSFPINHLRSPKGLSLARNRGLAVSGGAYVGFPDDDCWYRPETLADVASKFRRHGKLCVVTGRTVDASDKPSLSPSGNLEVDVDRKNYLSCGNSNSIFVTRQLLDVIGGFDERLGVGAVTPFQSGEEADLLLRAVAAGKSARYFPDIVVHHDQVDDVVTSSHATRAAKYGRGFGALMRKHRFDQAYVFYRILRPFLSALVALLRGDAMTAKYKWAWLKGIAIGYWTWDSVSSRLPFSTTDVARPSSGHPIELA